MTRIIQISDPHIVPNGQLAYGQVDTAAALASCVKTVNRLLPEIGPVDLACLLYTSPSPRDGLLSRMPSSA